ncbi:MAG: hypothetical protein HY670_05745 [Chloroflexi bacterium]|nr:hypothetical protein [Chloroflexota bacterium]
MAAIRRHILIGVGGGLVLLGIYLGILSLAQGFTHALQQALSMWYWVLALVSGFGIQVGLFSFIRQAMHARRVAATSSVATSGGVSTGSMLACCAHHLSDVLPFLGLSGLAAVLVRFQTFFIIAGVLSNIVGITIMLETIQRHNLCSRVAGWSWHMGRVKKGAMATAGVLLVAAFFITMF